MMVIASCRASLPPKCVSGDVSRIMFSGVSQCTTGLAFATTRAANRAVKTAKDSSPGLRARNWVIPRRALWKTASWKFECLSISCSRGLCSRHSTLHCAFSINSGWYSDDLQITYHFSSQPTRNGDPLLALLWIWCHLLGVCATHSPKSD